MKWLGGVDMALMKSQPTFWRVIDGAQNSAVNSSTTIGVLSGHFGGWITERRSYRTRGLWVAPDHRGKGLARLLMRAAFEQAIKENCELVWTFPRKASMPFYESMGFELIGSWIDDSDPQAGEFGPNGFALAKTNRHESAKAP